MAARLGSLISPPARVRIGTLVLGIVCSPPVYGQQVDRPQSSHITIPFLANATRPADLDFEGGECDIDQTGNTMECQFQQVFLTTSDLAPESDWDVVGRDMEDLADSLGA